MQTKKLGSSYFCKETAQNTKINIINHFTAGPIGIHSKLSGIADEGIHLIITRLLPQHRTNPKTWQGPEYPESESRSTLQLT